MADERSFTQKPALSWLWGARLTRVDGPAPGLFVFSLSQEGQKLALLVWVTAHQRGVGATPERPKGQPASAYVQRLRRAENARLEHAHWLCPPTQPDRALALELCFARGELRQRVVADFDAKAPCLVMLRADATVEGASDERGVRSRLPDRRAPWVPGSGRGITPPEDAAGLWARGEALQGTARSESDHALKYQLRTQARAALRRAERKVEAIRGDLERAQAVPMLRREASLLLCHVSSVPRGASQVRLLDEGVEPPTFWDIRLDPTRDAAQNAQQRFERARKLERGLNIAGERLLLAEQHARALRDFLARLEDDSPEMLRGAAEPLGLEVPRDVVAPKRGQKQVRTPYRSFVGAGQRSILVGKGAADNDALTLTVARPHDYWLHARGVHGAHVVVPLARGSQIAPELLLDAAHLAAHFSAVRGEPSAEIQHTERRYIRKPKGAAPGAVNVDREKVLLLRIEPERLARLLSSER